VEGSFIVEQASFLVRLDAATGNVVWNVSVSGNDGNPGSWRSHVTADDSAAFMYTTRDNINRVDFYTGGFLYSARVSLGGRLHLGLHVDRIYTRGDHVGLRRRWRLDR
jgi:outer membrane protein assembly factor BamB